MTAFKKLKKDKKCMMKGWELMGLSCKSDKSDGKVDVDDEKQSK